MTSIPPDPNLPTEGSPAFIKQLRFQLDKMLRAIAYQLNGISNGDISAFTTAYTAAPTTGKHAKGDFIMNSAPSVAGSPSSQYIVHGWRCTVSGEPGTWVEVRTLTGT